MRNRTIRGTLAALAVSTLAAVGLGLSADTASAATSLPYAPPTLTNPTTVTVSNTNRDLKLDTTKDYIVKFPSTAITAGQVSIYGGHNVVIRGGEVAPSADTVKPDPAVKGSGGTNVLYPHGFTGSLHIEGMKLGNASGYSQDLIRIQGAGSAQSPNSTITIENIDARRGNYGFNKYNDGTNGPHSDVVQFYGGSSSMVFRAANLQADKVGYQGLMLQSGTYGDEVKSTVLRDVSIRHLASKGGYTVFDTNGGGTRSVTGLNMYVSSNTGNGYYRGHGLTATELANLFGSGAAYHPVTDTPRNVLYGTPGAGYVPPTSYTG